MPGWPPELGGRDATAVQQMIYFEEMAAGEIPRSLNPQGLSIVTPSIVDHGTEEQRQRWALPTLRGEITWCLGMSEPGAGSDLASLSTRAVLDGDRPAGIPHRIAASRSITCSSVALPRSLVAP